MYYILRTLSKINSMFWNKKKIANKSLKVYQHFHTIPIIFFIERFCIFCIFWHCSILNVCWHLYDIHRETWRQLSFVIKWEFLDKIIKMFFETRFIAGSCVDNIVFPWIIHLSQERDFPLKNVLEILPTIELFKKKFWTKCKSKKLE